MRQTKRLLALVLALVMTLSLTVLDTSAARTGGGKITITSDTALTGKVAYTEITIKNGADVMVGKNTDISGVKKINIENGQLSLNGKLATEALTIGENGAVQFGANSQLSASGKTEIYTADPFTGTPNNQFKPTGEVVSKTTDGATDAKAFSGKDATVNENLTPTEPETPAVETVKVTLDTSKMATGYKATILNAKGLPATDAELAAYTKNTKLYVKVERTNSDATALNAVAFEVKAGTKALTMIDNTGHTSSESAAYTVTADVTITVDIHESEGYYLTLGGDLIATTAATVNTTLADGDAFNGVYAKALQIKEGQSVTITKGSKGDTFANGAKLYLNSVKTAGIKNNTLLGTATADPAVTFKMPAGDVTITEDNFATLVATHYAEGLTLTAKANADKVVDTDTANRVIYTAGTATTFTVAGADHYMAAASEDAVTGTGVAKNTAYTASAEKWIKPAVQITKTTTGTVKDGDAALGASFYAVPGGKLTVAPATNLGMFAYATEDTGTVFTGTNIIGKWTVPTVDTTLVDGIKVTLTGVSATINGTEIKSGDLVLSGKNYKVAKATDTAVADTLMIVPTTGTAVAVNPTAGEKVIAASGVKTTADAAAALAATSANIFVAVTKISAGTAIEGATAIVEDGSNEGYYKMTTETGMTISDLTTAQYIIPGTKIYVQPVGKTGTVKIVAKNATVTDEEKKIYTDTAPSNDYDIFSLTVGAEDILLGEEPVAADLVTISIKGLSGQTAKVSAASATSVADLVTAMQKVNKSMDETLDGKQTAGTYVKIDGMYLNDSSTPTLAAYLASKAGETVEVDFGYVSVDFIGNGTSDTGVVHTESDVTATVAVTDSKSNAYTASATGKNLVYLKKGAEIKVTVTAGGQASAAISTAEDIVTVSGAAADTFALADGTPAPTKWVATLKTGNTTIQLNTVTNGESPTGSTIGTITVTGTNNITITVADDD